MFCLLAVAPLLSLGQKVLTPQVGYFQYRYPPNAIITHGFMAGVMYGDGSSIINNGPGAGIEYLPHQGLIAPKIWYEAELALVTGRVDLTYYGYRGSRDVRLCPQIGLGGG